MPTLRRRRLWQLGASLACVAAAAACGSDDESAPTTTLTATGSGGGTGGTTTGPGGTAGTGTGATGAAGGDGLLATTYPCDQGIEADPAFVFGESFEEGSIDAVVARYSSPSGQAGMALQTDVSPTSCGTTSMSFTADPAMADSSLYNQLANFDELYTRANVKYQAGVTWHHTGLGFKAYNPPSPWPLGLAGLRPNGDDSLSVRVEPVWGVGAPNPRLDFYNYWMQMHSWMDVPSGDQAYYGNAVVHQQSFTAEDETWMCLEIHVKLNTDLASSAGGELDVWKNDVLVQHFDAASPTGCWIRDKFCPQGADGNECTDYSAMCQQPYVPLDLRWRSSSALQLNAISFGNYITEGVAGTVAFDDVVVATRRIGCVHPAG